MSDDRSKGDYDWLFDPDAKNAPRPKPSKPAAPPTANLSSGATPPPAVPPSSLPPPKLPPPKKAVKAGRGGTRTFGLPKWWRLSTGAPLGANVAAWRRYPAVSQVQAWSGACMLTARHA